jgi:hypothetical protein
MMIGLHVSRTVTCTDRAGSSSAQRLLLVVVDAHSLPAVTRRATEEHPPEGTSAPWPYPGADDAVARGRDPQSVDSPSRWRRVLVIVVAVLVILMFVALHLTGAVGPSAH